MKVKLALLAAAGALAMASAAVAQERTGYYGALGAGVAIENESNDFEGRSAFPAAFDSQFELDTNVAIYGAIGKYFGNGFRGEVEFATRTQQIEALAGDGLGFAGFPANSQIGDVSATTLMLNAYKSFAIDAAGRLEPYIGAGFGAARVRPEFDNISDGIPAVTLADMATSNRVVVGDKDYVPAGQAMAGLTFDFTENMMIDVRYRYLQTGDVDFGGFVNDIEADLESQYIAHEALIGFRWNWGGTVAPVQEPEAVQYKTCFDGSRVAVTADCPVERETVDTAGNVEPLIVYFDYDKANLTEAARTLIAARAEEALAADVKAVAVQGNTDTSGSSAYNQALSTRRGAVVRDALVANGIDGSVITVEALGESNPAKPTGDGVREPLNRRTEVTFSF